MKQLLLVFWVFATALVFAGDPVPIGTSQSKFATAFNNARKIARTQGDRRLVVYQDSLAGKKIVRLTFSDDGLTWSAPQTLGDGQSPCIAVGAGDTFYVAWSKWRESVITLMMFGASDLPALANAQDIDIYYGNPGAANDNPVLDVGPRFVHLAFQQNTNAVFGSSVKYGLFFHNLQPATPIYTISAANTTATNPTLQTDLEFASDYVNIFWHEQQQVAAGLHHLSLNAARLYELNPGTETEFWTLLHNDLAHINASFPQLGGCKNASISVRTEENGGGENRTYNNRLVLGCDDVGKSLFRLFTLDFATGSASVDLRGGYTFPSAHQVWPSVDDVLLNPRSCAVLWENRGSILYGQSEYADIVTNPLIDVSVVGTAHYASVCYKTFRSALFDVVWTQGESAPFTIVYRRMDKKYWFEHVRVVTDSLRPGCYKKPYEQQISFTGGLNKPVLKIVSGELPEGLTFAERWKIDGKYYISGTPVKSGVYPITLQASDIGEDFGINSEPVTLNLWIRNLSPRLDGDSEIVTNPGSAINYRFTCADPDTHAVVITFKRKPDWLVWDKHTKLSGTVPDTISADFVILASDGDKTDSLVVALKSFPTAAHNKKEALPETMALFPVYPNPFNNTATIKIDMPARQQAVVSLYDLTGRLVQTLNNGQLEAGQHTLHLRAGDLPSGTYFIRMVSARQVFTQKCILLK